MNTTSSAIIRYRFAAMTVDGAIKPQAAVPRNELGRLMEPVETKSLFALSMIGAAWVTRFHTAEETPHD